MINMSRISCPDLKFITFPKIDDANLKRALSIKYEYVVEFLLFVFNILT